MVSFSCEACGDVLTKKKLDPHRGQCRGASFTCIDCMVHFYGLEYRAHTSCMTEAQKYQGALYKEKPQKGKKGQNNKQNPNQTPNGRQQQARVEDAPPPPAPTPPPVGEVRTIAPAPANNDKPVNVFDYLVADETPNASKVALVEPPKEQMKMNPNAKSVFEPSESLTRVETNPNTDDEGKNYDVAYQENGFSYGAGHIPHSASPPNASTTEFVTPAPKKKKDRKVPGTVSEKKRKRGQAEVLSTPGEAVDTAMMDAPSSIINNAGTPMLNHSGLTGGLNRMMRSASPDGDDSPETSRRAYQDTSSPIKRSRRNGKEANGNGDPGLGISMKNRAGRLVSSMFGGSAVSSTNGSEPGSKAVAHARRGSSSSGDGQLEVRKSKKSHRSRADDDDSRKSKRKSSNPTDGDRPSRRLKQIDERRGSVDSSHGHQVTVYKQSRPPARTDEDLQRELGHHFLSLVASHSERGCSVNKALKRFHRDLSDEYDADRGRDNGRSRADRERRVDDEKDLFRALRLRRNDRGEIVVFI
ncbi:Zinc finger, C2H2, LYAR-type [Penicillium camemberti]|uniref:Zinc finger, C2H2, LYAR-type n=1 Tax=Penicillium camemberti (strain FM 013) TaxID=1429867 RepID=A0A0G4PMW1_PENC3|nr:Zinc finger, C2H2, LYAR-type [Penicillium camemberti]